MDINFEEEDDFDWHAYIRSTVEGVAREAAKDENDAAYQFSDEDKARAAAYVASIIPSENIPMVRLIVSTMYSLARRQIAEDVIREVPEGSAISQAMQLLLEADGAELPEDKLLELAHIILSDSSTPEELRKFMQEIVAEDVIKKAEEVIASDPDLSVLTDKVTTKLEGYSDHELFQRVQNVLDNEDN